MQIAYRQGYDLFRLEKDGIGFRDAVAFLLRRLRSPYQIDGLPPGEPDLTFTNDPQAFSWMEIWLSHVQDPEIENFVRVDRPVLNRCGGGYRTRYSNRPYPQARRSVENGCVGTSTY